MRGAYTRPKNWDAFDRIVGTREDISKNGIKRLCFNCANITFTDQKYPDDIQIICDVCFNVNIAAGEEYIKLFIKSGILKKKKP
jgi:hypothetical protein